MRVFTSLLAGLGCLTVFDFVSAEQARFIASPRRHGVQEGLQARHRALARSASARIYQHGEEEDVALVSHLLSVRASSKSPLRNFELNHPPLVIAGEQTEACRVMLLEHQFSNSYGHPALVTYTPPTGPCGDSSTWQAIALNLTVTSQGVQFDRLASIQLGHVEVWRSSTAEPTRDGIIWTTLKDVSVYRSLFAKEQPLLMDLGNIVNSQYTSPYNVELSLNVYTASPPTSAPNHMLPPAPDVIIPLSTISNTTTSIFSVPNTSVSPIGGGVMMVTLPSNAERALVEIYASGNADEEFWYSNIDDKCANEFPSGAVIAKGPFREVQLLIDGQLAGVAFPYPVIFTGGLNPFMWRPQVSYGAFDQPTYLIDITPFLPSLSDSAAHNFTLNVVGESADHSINGNWFVSGNVQLVLSASEKRTTGNMTKVYAPPYATVEVSGRPEGNVSANGSLTVNVEVMKREIDIVGYVETGDGKKFTAGWKQELSYSNVQTYTDGGLDETVVQSTHGKSESTIDGAPFLTDVYFFPLSVLLTENSTSLFSQVNHTYTRTTTFASANANASAKFSFGRPASAHTDTTQHAQGYFWSSGGRGETRGTYSYDDALGHTFEAQALVANATVVSERRSGSLAKQPDEVPFSTAGSGTGDDLRFSSNTSSSSSSSSSVPLGAEVAGLCRGAYVPGKKAKEGESGSLFAGLLRMSGLGRPGDGSQ